MTSLRSGVQVCLLAALAGAGAAACRHEPPPSRAGGAEPGAVSSAAALSSASAVAPPSASAVSSSAAPFCPLVPLKLTIRAPGHEPVAMLSLAADGRIAVTSMGGPAPSARLNPRGCLVGPDGLWAELTAADKLWTAHELLEVDGTTLRLPGGAGLRISSAGQIERVAADGKVEPNTYGTTELEGFVPSARCAGLLLLATWLSMMPSMAVVDGHPARAPVPEGSHCLDFPRP